MSCAIVAQLMQDNDTRELLADIFCTRGHAVQHSVDLFGDCQWSLHLCELVRERNAATGGLRDDSDSRPWPAWVLAAARGESLPRHRRAAPTAVEAWLG